MADNRSFLATAAGIAGAAAVLTLSGRPSAPPAATQVTSAAARAGVLSAPPAESIVVVSGKQDTRKYVFHEGERLLNEFRAIDSTNRGLKVHRRYEIDVLVATIADPLDSHLDWMFDEHLDAMRRAFEVAGYATDRMWLPWRDSLSAPGCPARGTRRYCPGVVLFRHWSHDKLRVLYLVGELPTSGVYTNAFRVALAERQRILSDSASYTWPAPAAPDSASAARLGHVMWDSVRILGPTFSGSVRSLRNVLEALQPICHRRWFSVITGTATSVQSRSLTDSCPCRFVSTVHSDDAMNAGLGRVIGGLDIKPSQVAVLTEGNTGYGVDLETHATGPPDTVGVLRVRFPVNIGSLRTAYAQNAAQTASGRSVGTVTPRVPLALDDPGPRENVPTMSNLTVPTLDIWLDAMARTLIARDTRLIVIQATDVRDKMFLATELKRRIRDVQLLTYESHLLFERPDAADVFRGMLVLSTYPLTTDEQSVTLFTDSRGMAFSSNGAEGVYNAALLHLGDRHDLMDYESPLDSTGLPAIWLSAIGSNGPVALTSWPGITDSAYVARRDTVPGRRFATPRVDRFPLVTLPFYLAGAFCLLAILAIVRVWPHPSRFADAVSRFESFGYAATLLFALSGIGIVLLHLVFASRLANAVAALYIRRALFLADLALVLFTMVQAIAVWFGGDAEDPTSSLWSRLWLFITTQAKFDYLARAGVGVVTIVFWVFIWQVAFDPTAHTADHRFAIREVALTDGLSPFPPIIIAGSLLALWSLWRLRVRALADTHTACERWFAWRTEHLTARQVPIDTLLKSTACIRKRVEYLVPDYRSIGILALLAGITWLMQYRFQHSLEWLARVVDRTRAVPVPFDAILKVSILLAMLGCVWECYRAMIVWSALRAFLVQLRYSPLLTAFERMSPLVARSMRRTVFSVGESSEVYNFSRTRWRHMCRIIDRAGGAFASEPRLLRLIRAVRHGRVPMMERQVKAVPAGKIMPYERVYRALLILWDAEPASKEDLMSAVDAVQGDATAAARGEIQATRGVSYVMRRVFPSAARLWMRAAEEWLAVQVVDYIEWVLQYLRRLVLFLLGALLLTVMLVSSYPFMPQDYFKTVLLFILIGVSAALIWILVGMNRDEVISRISGAAPGQVSWDRTFLVNLAVPAILLFLAVAGAIFPVVHDFVSVWISPILGSNAR